MVEQNNQVDQELLVFGVGNPLLDIAKEFSDDTFMDKYGLKHASACLASPEQLPLYEELMKMEGIDTIPGGSALNTIRATAYMLKATNPNAAAYAGCIGKDAAGEILEKESKQDGVQGYFYHDEATPTGTCAVIVRHKDRSLCANLAAALKFPLKHIEENRSVLEKAKILYTTSFFITSNFDALLYVAKYAAEANKPFGLNLSAGFLIQFNTEQVNAALQYADFVFGNEDEAQIYADVNKVAHENLRDVALAIAKSKKVNTERPRVVIISQGSKPVIVATYQDGKTEEVTEVEVPAIPADQIVDTNGAGDSFAGGFLARLALGDDVITAIKAGIWLSGEVVKRSSCTFPEINTYKA